MLYWLFPIIYWTLDKIDEKVQFYVPMGVAVISWIIAIALKMFGIRGAFSNNGFYYFSVLVQSPCFICGCICQKGRKCHSNGNAVCCGLTLFALVGFAFALNEKLNAPLALIMPVFFSYGVLLIDEVMEGKKIAGKNWITKVLSWFGRNSYYVFLAHPFFCWTMPVYIFKIIKIRNIGINSTMAYLCMLPFMFLFSAVLAVVLRNICNPIVRRLQLLGSQSNVNA